MGWKEKRRADGWRDLLVWLDPTAVAGLEALKARSPGASVADLVSKAVLLAAGMGLPAIEVAGPAAGAPDHEVAELKDQVASLAERLARLESARVAEVPSEPEPIDQVVPVEVEPPVDQVDPQEPGPEPEHGDQEPVHEQELDQAPVDEPEPIHPQQQNGALDYPAMLEAVADMVEQAGGWTFNVSALYRELFAKGVKVHAHSQGFCAWVSKHKTEVKAILKKRRATRGEG